MHRKISAHIIDGGLSGGSSMRRPGIEDPIGVSGNFVTLHVEFCWQHLSSIPIEGSGIEELHFLSRIVPRLSYFPTMGHPSVLNSF